MISEECLLLYRCTRNTTISTSTSNFGSSGRVDGPLLGPSTLPLLPKLLVLVDMVVFPCTYI